MISLSHSHLDLYGWLSLNLPVAGKNPNFIPLFLTVISTMNFGLDFQTK